MTAIHFITARRTVRSSDQWRKTMKNKARLFILLALSPIIIGLAGFDSNVEARHRRYWRDGGFYGVGFNRFGPCCQAPCPVACPAPCPVACPAPAPVLSCPAPAPVISSPAPAPWLCCPAPAPVFSCPAPAPVVTCPAPAPVMSCPAPAPVISCPTCP